MNRVDLQQLAEDRVADAAALLAAGRWSAAYYLAGYTVECAIKACIAKRVAAEDFPDKQLATDSYTHDFRRLLKPAKLEGALDLELKASPAFSANWLTAVRWSEVARYGRYTEQEARALYDSVTDDPAGVLTWLRKFW